MENPTTSPGLDQETEKRLNEEVSRRTRKERLFVYLIAAISIPLFLSAFFFNAEARKFYRDAQESQKEANKGLAEVNSRLEEAIKTKTMAQENFEEAKAAKTEAVKQLKEASTLSAKLQASLEMKAADNAHCQKALMEARTLHEETLKMPKAHEDARPAKPSPLLAP